MTRNSVKKTAAPSFRSGPLFTLLILAFLGILAVGWIMESWRTRTLEFSQKAGRLEELCGQIVHLDEVLTMSATMAASSGNRRWVERYRLHEPQLDAAIRDAGLLEPTISGELAAQEINNANLQLVKMETTVLDLVERGEYVGARTIMESAEYWRFKDIYASGLKSLRLKMRQDNLTRRIELEGHIQAEKALAGIILGALFLVAFITQRKLASARKVVLESAGNLRMSRRVNQIINTAHDAVVTMSESGQVTGWNIRAENMFGYSQSEANERDLAELIIPPEFREAHRTGLAGFLKSGMGPVLGKSLELTALRKGGVIFPIEISISAIMFDGQHVFTAFIRDISERKSLEMQLQHAQKMESIGRLAGGVAHEFNNMLVVIRGYAEQMRESMEASAPYAWKLEEIIKAADRSASVTHQLLAFTRKQVARPVVIELGAHLAGMSTVLGKLIGETIRLEICPSPDPLWILMDGTQFEQVIINLVINARDAMADRGCISISTLMGEPDSGGEACIMVKDDGCGMDGPTLKRIFEPFFTTKDVGAGTGLGLSMVHGIVTQNGGRIDVESSPGKGSTFTITLPFHQTDVHSDATAQPLKPTTEGHHARILLVEDEDMVRIYYESILEEAGHSVFTSHNGMEALERFGGAFSQFNLVICDVIMPGMSGPELVSHIELESSSMPVIYISGYTQDELKKYPIKGKHCLLMKPFEDSALLEQIQKSLASTATNPS